MVTTLPRSAASITLDLRATVSVIMCGRALLLQIIRLYLCLVILILPPANLVSISDCHQTNLCRLS